MTVKKAKPAKRKSASKKAAKKKAKVSLCDETATRKRASKKPVARPYVEPKTAAELGIVCPNVVDGEKCGAAVVLFDYAIGEKASGGALFAILTGLATGWRNWQ